MTIVTLFISNLSRDGGPDRMIYFPGVFSRVCSLDLVTCLWEVNRERDGEICPSRFDLIYHIP